MPPKRKKDHIPYVEYNDSDVEGQPPTKKKAKPATNVGDSVNLSSLTALLQCLTACPAFVAKLENHFPQWSPESLEPKDEVARGVVQFLFDRRTGRIGSCKSIITALKELEYIENLDEYTAPDPIKLACAIVHRLDRATNSQDFGDLFVFQTRSTQQCWTCAASLGQVDDIITPFRPVFPQTGPLQSISCPRGYLSVGDLLLHTFLEKERKKCPNTGFDNHLVVRMTKAANHGPILALELQHDRELKYDWDLRIPDTIEDRCGPSRRWRLVSILVQRIDKTCTAVVIWKDGVHCFSTDSFMRKQPGKYAITRDFTSGLPDQCTTKLHSATVRAVFYVNEVAPECDDLVHIGKYLGQDNDNSTEESFLEQYQRIDNPSWGLSPVCIPFDHDTHDNCCCTHTELDGTRIYFPEIDSGGSAMWFPNPPPYKEHKW